MSESWFIVGSGYTCTKLARALVGQGVDVTITRLAPSTEALHADGPVHSSAAASRTM